MGGKNESARSLKGNGGTLLSPLVCPLEVLKFFWPVGPSHWACNPRQLLPDFRPGLIQTGAKVKSNWSGTHLGRFQLQPSPISSRLSPRSDLDRCENNLKLVWQPFWPPPLPPVC